MLETHVTNLEQSRKLYELGFRKESQFGWIKDGDKHYVAFYPDKEKDFSYYLFPAYLLSEIITHLPLTIERHNTQLFLELLSCEDGQWYAGYGEEESAPQRGLFDMNILGNSILEAAYDLLIWCIENGFISTK